MLQSMGLQKVEHDLGLNNDNDNNLCSLSPYSIPSFKFSPSFQVFFFFIIFANFIILVSQNQIFAFLIKNIIFLLFIFIKLCFFKD